MLKISKNSINNDRQKIKFLNIKYRKINNLINRVDFIKKNSKANKQNDNNISISEFSITRAKLMI